MYRLVYTLLSICIGKSLDIIKARLNDTIRLWFNVISAKLEINIADNLAD